MFLSRLRLHPRDLAVLRDLGDVAELHRSVMRAFPPHDGPEPRRALGVLYRRELHVTAPTLLVQSRDLPDWDALPEGYILEREVREASPVLAAGQSGRVLRFRLVANPSRKSAAHRPDEPPPSNSRRVALTGETERHEWLKTRGERAGFTLCGTGTHDGVRLESLPPLLGGRRAGKPGLYVRPVLFEGLLEVVNADAFRAAVQEGIGPAKAYGCGLLSVAAAR